VGASQHTTLVSFDHRGVSGSVRDQGVVEVSDGLTGPTDEELVALIKPYWIKARPSETAQSIRARLSTEIDDGKYPQWALDYVPDYVWDLVDIAAQRGMDAATPKKGEE
jgi:hypothetical protein